MYWWIPMAAGAALGALKNNESQAASAEDRKLQAIRELWSPFTGQHGSTPKSGGSLMGDIGSGAIAGLAMGQSFDRATPSEKGAVTQNLWQSSGQGATDGGPVDIDGLPINKYGLNTSKFNLGRNRNG